MRTYTYQSTNPLARTNPLRSIPFLRPAAHVLRPVRSPLFLARWELDRALPDIASAEKQYAYARQCLGDANRRARGFGRRNAQAQAMRFLNKSRAALRAAHKRVAAAQAAVDALLAQPALPVAA